MKRHFVVVKGLAALVLAVVLAAGTLTALELRGALMASMADANAEDNRFNERSLEGSWGFSEHGFFAEIPQAIVGLYTFDGKGACTRSLTRNRGGEILVDTTEECTYEVNSDGTGTIQVRRVSTYAFVLVDEAEEFHFILAIESPIVSSGIAKRQ